MANPPDKTPKGTLTRDLLLKIRGTAGYKGLDASARALAESIIRLAISKNQTEATYYLQHLLALLETPYQAPNAPSNKGRSLKSMQEAETDASIAVAKNRKPSASFDDWDQSEEFLCNHLDRRWEYRFTSEGSGRKVFRIDGSKASPRFVKVKVRLIGDPLYIAKLRSLEDLIEKLAKRPGYILDLEFVDLPGYDVLTVNANSELWADAGNWAGGAETMAHELHHALGLDDRYDYITSHARNEHMPTATRMHWFLVQMRKGRDPRRSASMMGDGGVLLSEDICAIGGPLKRPARLKCEAAQSFFDPPGLPKLPRNHMIHRE
ncbi:MAG TPA: hypothetical protein VFQ61_20045 [Polyangiaceae bacterium]|nr:hypothetical protein [Polyangiaceae bacterium]